MDCLHTAKYEVYVWRASKAKNSPGHVWIHCISLVNTKFVGGSPLLCFPFFTIFTIFAKLFPLGFALHLGSSVCLLLPFFPNLIEIFNLWPHMRIGNWQLLPATSEPRPVASSESITSCHTNDGRFWLIITMQYYTDGKATYKLILFQDKWHTININNSKQTKIFYPSQFTKACKILGTKKIAIKETSISPMDIKLWSTHHFLTHTKWQEVDKCSR